MTVKLEIEIEIEIAIEIEIGIEIGIGIANAARAARLSAVCHQVAVLPPREKSFLELRNTRNTRKGLRDEPFVLDLWIVLFFEQDFAGHDFRAFRVFRSSKKMYRLFLNRFLSPAPLL